jgi:hypothetical protein
MIILLVEERIELTEEEEDYLPSRYFQKEETRRKKSKIIPQRKPKRKDVEYVLREGWWSTHDYHRRKVKEDILGELGGFVGWDYLIDLCERAKPRTAALMATTFETGGRIAEVVGNRYTDVRGLIKRQFRVHPKNSNLIEVRGMEVQKLKEKVDGKWVRKLGYRNISIRRDEPLVPIMMGWVKKLKNREQKLFDFTPTWAYVLMRKVDKSVWCHWFRAQRACQLVEDYDFNIPQLQKFFGWKRFATPLEYTSLSRGVLEKKMLGTKTSFQTEVIK